LVKITVIQKLNESLDISTSCTHVVVGGDNLYVLMVAAVSDSPQGVCI